MNECLCKTCVRETCRNAGHDTCIVKCSGYCLSKPATNADRIRSMSDEELAMWINDITTNALSVLTLGSDRQTKSIFYWFDWLKQRIE